MASDEGLGSIVSDGLEALKLVSSTRWLASQCPHLGKADFFSGLQPDMASKSSRMDLCASRSACNPVGMFWSQFSHWT